MKVVRIEEKGFKHRIASVPPHAISGFFYLDDLVLLRRTHKYFSGVCKIASPIINLTIADGKITEQFPKARLLIDSVYDEILPQLERSVLPRVTSLNISRESMELGTIPEIVAMTKIMSVHFPYSYPVTRSLLTKLTDLRKLSLASDMALLPDDLSSLPITSLSTNGGTPLSVETFRSLKLTELGTNAQNIKLLSDELVQNRYTILTNLNLEIYREDVSILVGTIAKMAWLRELTIRGGRSFPYVECLSNLTNLTYLKIGYDNDPIRIPFLPRLETFILVRLNISKVDFEFPLFPLDNLTHVEIKGYDIKFNTRFMKNLTSLNYDQQGELESRQLCEFKKLARLTLINNEEKSKVIDITYLNSLTSLKSGGTYYLVGSQRKLKFVRTSDNIVNRNLESLDICGGNNILGIDDDLLEGFPNLRSMSIRRAAPELKGSCFKKLPNLFLLKIGRINNLSSESLSLLMGRGVLIKYYRN
ncbi:MAG: hypothetical protein Hyperionvirus1_201 [Hyperionvirus sp.]|uniref:Uncharacterized protein n=1 Tax=Hyperionvirus sp. TaxID=2487770 RepID=A0A3G5A6G9_9VIRU|nr:MAG: hypothetical protein Hyperionvirus1_201 [Hyperionvirus sp.]